MTSRSKFLESVSHRVELGAVDAAQLLPTILMTACTDVLPIAGAGISIVSDIRLPLGSSDRHAAFVERLQFTTGVGPCMEAAATGQASKADADLIASRWPAFNAEMTAATPYGSTMSFPLSVAGFTAALDMYSSASTFPETPTSEQITTAVVEPISALMSQSPMALDRLGVELPVWMTSESVDARLEVWRAVGMIMQVATYTSADALAELRACSFGRSTSLDQVSRDLVERRLDPQDVLDH